MFGKSFSPKKIALTAVNPSGFGGLLAADKVSGENLLSGAKSMLGQNKFKGGVSPIDKKAFDIKGGQEAAGIAGSRSKIAAQQAGETKRIQDILQGKRGALIQDLERKSRGEGPSLAQEQLKQAQDRSLKQQLAAAGRSRGASAAATQRALMRSQAQQAQQLGREATQARMQEQEMARQQLASAITSGQQIEQQERAMEEAQVEKYLGMGFNMNQAMQRAKADLESLKVQQELGLQRLQQASFDAAQTRRASMGSGMLDKAVGFLAGSDKKMKKNINKESYESLSPAGKKKNIKKESLSYVKGSASSEGINKRKKLAVDLKSKQETKKTKPKQETKKAEPKKEKGYKGLTGIAASFERVADAIRSDGSDFDGGDPVAKSDKNAKKNIKKEFLDKLKAYSYEYKNPNEKGAGKGRFLSVMAQDLEKAGPLGKSMVREENGTKMVDYGKGFGTILAAQAALNERLNELEKKKRK